MSDEAKRYNGWANYETWCVHLWLTNEEGSYRYWRDEARRHRREARRLKNASGSWTAKDEERLSLAVQLQSELEEASPELRASQFADLLNTALDRVNCYEIAEAFLEDLEPAEGDDDQADEER